MFPIVLYGYSAAAREAYNSLMPGARQVLTFILGVILAICGWNFVTAFGAEEFIRVFRPIYGHASGLAIVIAILALSRSMDGAKKARVMCLIIMAVSLGSTVLIAPRSYNDRYPGFFKHPNQLGLIAAMATLYFFCEMMSARGRQRLWLALGLVLSAYAMLLSGSKTNLLIVAALCVCSVPLLAFQRLNIRAALNETYRNLIVAGGMLFIGGMALSLTSERAFNVLSTLLSGEQEVEQYHSINSRDHLWEESWQQGTAHPLTGVGSGQLMLDGTEHSHNVLLDALRTTGFPGLGLTLLFIFAILFYALGAYKAARALQRQSGSRQFVSEVRGSLVGSLLALMSYILANQMSDSFGPTTIPFFYMYLGFSLTFFLPAEPGTSFVRACRSDTLPQR